MTDYRARVVDTELKRRMRVMGAVLIDGPKAVGKTRTASQVAETVLRLDVDPVARAALETAPEQLFERPTPILFDEWQDTPALWNHVRRAVDDRGEKGLYLLTGSATPRDTARMHSGAGRIARLRMRPMSLFESGHSDGSVSLAALLNGDEVSGSTNTLTVPQLLERIVIGGLAGGLLAEPRGKGCTRSRNAQESPEHCAAACLTRAGRRHAPQPFRTGGRGWWRWWADRIRDTRSLPRRTGAPHARRTAARLATAHAIADSTSHDAGPSLRRSIDRNGGSWRRHARVAC